MTVIPLPSSSLQPELLCYLSADDHGALGMRSEPFLCTCRAPFMVISNVNQARQYAGTRTSQWTSLRVR
jgi:hypothetical protein